MKTKKYKKIIAAVVLGGAPLLWSACSDTWDNHYDVSEGGMAGQATLFQNIANDKDLTIFYNVIDKIGGTETLNSPQQLTVWAPIGLTSSQADSIIQVYEKDKAAGMKWEDNKAVTQFFYNHAARFLRPVSSLTNDTVRMLSNKYMNLIGTSNTSGTLNGNPFNEAILCNNGILYKTANVQTFFPNVREFLEQNAGMDSIASMIKSFDDYKLDEDASVAGGVVDGKTVYLDSVMNLYNRFLSTYGFIQREDSLYAFLAPTNEVWNREYEKYNKYFNYYTDNGDAATKAINDSLADINTKLAIVMGRFFNISKDFKYNRHPKDSLVNTMYVERQSHNPRSNVYYNPETGILDGLQRYECSNGYVYVDNKGVIDPHTTFFGRRDIPAYSSLYYEIEKDKDNSDMMNVSTDRYTIKDTIANTTDIYNFIKVTATKSDINHSKLTYTLPQTLSGVYYNIYLVTIPDEEKGLPCWFQVSKSEIELDKNGNGKMKEENYNNPHPVTSDPNIAAATFNNKERCYIASPEKVDTILIQAAVQFTYSGASLDDGAVKLTISSIGPSQAKWRETIYTRILRLNEIILVPFETKEEAEAAAEDLDAFNDKKLEANKEN